jgi:hypothetical protein
VIISEIMYAPRPFGLDPDQVDEFIELRNVSDQPVALYDTVNLTNAWRLSGAVQFTFPLGTIMPPWSYLVVVSFDPAHDPAALSWFQVRYGLGNGVVVFGPYAGHLANEGESLALYRPDNPEPQASPRPGFVPFVLVEEVHYAHSAPWPAAANGTGNSLQRLAAVSFADDPAHWEAAIATPGFLNPGAATADTDHDGAPDESEFIAGTDPADSADFLRVDVSLAGTNCTLEFMGHFSHTYTVEKRSSVGSGSQWTPVRSNLPGAGARIAVLDPIGLQPSFYRLKVTRN